MAVAIGCRSLLGTSAVLRRCARAQVLHIGLPARTASSARDEMKKYWETNLERKRPVAPFLSSYDLGLTGNLSLCHRITGIMMYCGLSAFGVGMLVLPGSFPEYLGMVKDLHMGSAILYCAKATLAFPLVFHFTNGIRHLSWDAGKGFDIKTTYNSGYLAMAIAAIATLGLAAL